MAPRQGSHLARFHGWARTTTGSRELTDAHRGEYFASSHTRQDVGRERVVVTARQQFARAVVLGEDERGGDATSGDLLIDADLVAGLDWREVA